METLTKLSEFNFIKVKLLSLLCRSINHKLRQQILKLIEEEKEITVTDIYVRLRLEQSVASQHLAILRKNKIVTTKREGKCIYYSVNWVRLGELKKIMDEIKL